MTENTSPDTSPEGWIGVLVDAVVEMRHKDRVERGETRKMLAEAFAQFERAARKDELEWIETHASGGGSWRRLIHQRLAALSNPEEPKND